jgi:HAD superfamily hydrolase (TIGR01509 family)
MGAVSGFDLIIFDCDGTLTDSEYLNNKATSDVLLALGFDTYTLGYCMDHLTGKSMGDIKQAIEAEYHRPLPESFVTSFVAKAKAYQKDYLKPAPGAVEAVHALGQTYKTCVASNGERGNVVSSLQGIGLYDFFGEDRIFTKSQVARGKPAPDLFLFAAEKMNAAPGRTVVIEDSVPGVLGAVAAGMEVIGYTGVNHRPDEVRQSLIKTGARQIFGSWDDIVAAISPT